MSTTIAPSAPTLRRWPLFTVLCATMLVLVTVPMWNDELRAQLIRVLGGVPATDVAETASQSPHDHAGHSDDNSLELSEQARRGIGLRTGPVQLSTFHRTITVPGIVVERPGRSQIDIIAPMTGFITKIYLQVGEAVAPEQPLFELRLTHEDLVQSQADLLRTTEELDVVRREIARLEAIGEGVIPSKTILERKYEQQKLEAAHKAQRQALLLHGLTTPQVDEIVATRVLFSTVTIRAPAATQSTASSTARAPLLVQELRVTRGRNVQTGESLAVLADHSQLLIEGNAFEHDLADISRSRAEQLALTVETEAAGATTPALKPLHIAYIANRIDSANRTLHFYVELPNELLGDKRPATDSPFVDWRFKPGQRMQLHVPVEAWPERMVLPTDAVAQDGVEHYVFRINGDHFDRQAVRVEYRDPQRVVIANDGSLFPGEQVALSAAQQLQLALKNKSGGGVDPHAGHTH